MYMQTTQVSSVDLHKEKHSVYSAYVSETQENEKNVLVNGACKQMSEINWAVFFFVFFFF